MLFHLISITQTNTQLKQKKTFSIHSATLFAFDIGNNKFDSKRGWLICVYMQTFENSSESTDGDSTSRFLPPMPPDAVCENTNG